MVKLKLSKITKSIETAVQIAESDDSFIGSAYPNGITSTLRYLEKNPDAPVAEAVNERIRMFDLAAEDEELQQEILQRCAKDPTYFINHWAWTYNPRIKPSTIPFNMFDRQAEFMGWLEERVERAEDGVVEKSRDTGLSYLCIAYAVWQFLFVPGSKVTFGSRKADFVDDLGNPDSLFEKVRIIMRNLPQWMRPDRASYSDTKMRFINRRNGCTITGEGGDNMGRGGRSSLYFVDEFAFVERADKVDAAISDNSDVKIYVSTPNGNGNSFAKKRHSGNFPVFNIHWLDDPRKWTWIIEGVDGSVIETGTGRGAPPGAIYPWYEKKKKTTDPVALAQEVDIDYTASVEGICIKAIWVRAAVDLALPAIGKQDAGLDIADGGKDDTVFIKRHGPVVRAPWIETREEGNTTQTAFWARRLAEKFGVLHLYFDADGVGAGVNGTLRSTEDIEFKYTPINGQASPSDVEWDEFGQRAGNLIFKNLRAELWWRLRTRFEKTYEHVNGIAEHPLSELISIPNHPELISQLSQPLRKYNSSGLILIESKQDMKSRGVDSPDFADALAYAFADLPTKEDLPSWFDRL